MRAAAVLSVLMTVAVPTRAQVAKAEKLAADALQLYADRDFARAGEMFLEAYALSDRAAVLRNAAKAFEAAELVARAIDAWERYAARSDVDAARRAEANEHLEKLRARVPPAEAPLLAPVVPPSEPVEPVEREALPAKVITTTPAPVAPPPPAPIVEPPRSEPSSNAALYYTLGGAGTVALITGGALFASGWITYGKFEDTMSTTQEISRADADRAELRSGVGIALGAVGACALSAAIILLASD